MLTIGQKEGTSATQQQAMMSDDHAFNAQEASRYLNECMYQ